MVGRFRTLNMINIQQNIIAGPLRPLRKLGLSVAKHWPWPVEVTIVNGRRMFVDLRSAVGRGIFATKTFDPEVFEPLRTVLKPGGAFLDVGANVGFYSMLALDLVGPKGAIHAFEIDERPLRCLRKTVQRLKLANFRIHEIAVGAAEGTGVLTSMPDCGHNTVRVSGSGLAVPITDLDTWRKKHGVRGIQAMKVDIEGTELEAIQGARQLIQEDRPLIVCEAATEWFPPGTVYEKEDLVGLLESLNYSVRWLDNVCSPTILARPL